MKRLAFLALLLLISLASPAFAEENVTELRIDDIATKVDSGSLLEFSFSVGNRVGPACAAQIEYWIGAEAEKIVSGRESIFLNESETKASTASLLVPDEVSGLHSFFIEMQCNDSTVVASKPMKATVPMPTILEFSSLDVSESLEQQLVGFSYIIESNTSPDKPISIQEKILQDNNVLWESSGEAVLAGVRSFERKGPMLPPGNYTLVVEAAYGGKTAVITRQFAVRSTFNIFSLLMLPALILAFAVAFVLAARFFFFGSAVQKAKPVAPAAGEPEFHTKQGLCVVESEASGVLDSSALNQLLDDAG
ncbi:MAG: hypothetical protein JW744_01110, partial [Candidatus Diapherotrites archaeon]|nr:hypothetical protein [Candidatus Diapherotrites archaeon]